MVNKTQFYKTKVALAVVLSLGLAACGDSEGDAGSTSTSTSVSESTDNVVGNQDSLSVSVSGVVVDTNNNPVAGATVALATETTTTDSNGQYVFTNVDVTNVAGVNNEGGEANDDVNASSLTITIQSSDDYLGGTVTITPEAQVNNTGGQGAGQSGGNSDTTVQTFISGYSYGAGKAVVPMLSAKITGYLTDCSKSYTSYDHVIEGAVVAADILKLGETATETATPGASFELSVPSIMATTDATGMFTITLPADSVSNILVDGWGLDTSTTPDSLADTNVIITNQTSNNEQVTENVGIIQVCPFATPDTTVPNVPPQVKSVSDYYGVDVLVDGSDAGTVADDNFYTHAVNLAATEDETDTDLVSTDRHYAVLSEGVVNNFTVNFSEALVDLVEADLVVTLNNAAAPAGTTIVLAADKTSAVITFAEDLEPQDLINFYLPQWQAVDADGAGVVSEGEDYIDLGLELDSTNKVGTYVRVSFCIFSRPDHDDAGITLIEQIIDADADEDGTFGALSDYSSSFADNLDNTTSIEQLNGQSLTDDRLDALAEEILKTTDATAGTSVSFDVDDARISYEDKAGSVVVTAKPTATVVEDSVNDIYEVQNTVDGAVVTATASNIFGVVKSTSVITVEDKVAPTTVLQENYGITGAGAPKLDIPMVTTAVTNGVTFGNGGEATDGVATVVGTVGNPIVYVQPRHLVARGTNIATFTERGNEFNALNEDMDDRLATGEATDVIGAYEERPSYDRQAIAAWDAQSQRIGVAVSEEVSVISTATMGTADISTAITAPTAFNGVTVNVDNGGTTNGSVDLVAVSVADVVSLANVDNGGVLSFANVIKDTSDSENVALPGLGSVGGANAQVVFQDAFPPMVETAEWNGTTFTIVFNEGVAVPTGTDTLDLNLVDARVANNGALTAITLNAGETDVNAEGYFTYDANTFTLVVNVSTGIETRFAGSSTADQEWFYADDIAGSNAQEQHAILNWDALNDLNGNSWDEFNPGAPSNGIEEGVLQGAALNATARWSVNAPQFLAVNTLGQLDVDLDFDNTTYNKRADAGWGGITDSDDAVTLQLTSTYPLNLDDTFNAGADASISNLTNTGVAGTANGLILSGAAIAFLLDETDFTIDTAASTGLVSKDRMTVTFNIVVNGVLTTDLIEAGDTVTINNGALDTPNEAEDTLGRVDAIQQLIFN